jgi:hypothetical protein
LLVILFACSTFPPREMCPLSWTTS